MNIYQISNLICIIFLIISSIQDILKKSVSDILHYLAIIFSITIFSYLFLTGYIPKNLIFSYLIFLFFFLMYIKKAIAVGDLYIMFFLLFFLANFEDYQFLKFMFSLAAGGNIMHSIEAIKIFLKKNNKKNVILFILSLFFSVLSISLFIKLQKDFFYEDYFIFLSSIIFLLISLIILKIYENKLKEMLKFERNIDELVEGDWIENEIEVINISKEFLKEIEKNFKVEKKDNKYIIKFQSNNNFRYILFLLVFIPIFFYNNLKLLFLSILFIILILTILHDYIFRDDLGLSKKQIELLKKIINKDTKFIVREGAPFLPAITLAYIFSII